MGRVIRCGAGLLVMAVCIFPLAGAEEPPLELAPLNLDSAPAPASYDPKATAMLMNLCRESLCRIIDYNDRFVLDEEYDKLANNIDVTQIRDDEIAALIKKLMLELNALKLDEAAKSHIVGYYERKLSSSVLAAVSKPPKDLLGKAAGPAAMACQAILLTAWGTTNRAKAIGRYQKELQEKVLTLREDELKRLAVLRTEFFDTEYTLYKRYTLPDRLNLKEVQLDQYIRVTQDENAVRRLERLERLKDDFQAFPPFWYQIGLAAQDTGNRRLALEYYARYDASGPAVLREDPDRVAVCMHRIVLLDPRTEREAIVRDLETIERNTKYYYRWENVLFAALTYYNLGDVENARRLVQTSINEGYNVPLHEEVRVAMESAASRGKLDATRLAMLDASNGIRFDSLMQVGRAGSLDALRAMGPQITGISLRVEPRSKGAQNAALAVPGYNVYLLGREAIKGDVYFDNVIVRLPLSWFDGDKPHVSFKFNGKTIKSADKRRDDGAGVMVVTFPRAFDQDDILSKGRVYPCTLKLEDDAGEMELDYEIRRVTADLLRYRPDLPKDEPYFELRTLDYMGESYRFDSGLIVPAR